MIDFLENFEIMANKLYDEMLQPNGRLKCECGRIFDFNKEGGFLSPNPYSIPVCGECLKKFIKD